MSTLHTAADETSLLKTRDREVLIALFAIDTRALAFLRIALAGFILTQVLVLREIPGEPMGWFPWVIGPLATLLMLGLKTRWMTVACWILFSIPVRSAMLGPVGAVDMGFYILNLMLFWGMFLPLGDTWSLDSRKQPSAFPKRVVSVATAAVLLQLFTIYLWAGVAKDFTEWVIDASALQTTLSHPDFGSDLGMALAAYPVILAIASVATIAIEVVGSILLLVPGRTLEARRKLLVTAFIGFHIGIALFMDIGMFPYLMIFVWTIFLPSSFWDRLSGRSSLDPDVVVVWDRNRIRNVLGGVTLAFVAVSNIISLLLYPAEDGLPALWQEVARYLLIYQRWAMFNVPSGI